MWKYEMNFNNIAHLPVLYFKKKALRMSRAVIFFKKDSMFILRVLPWFRKGFP